MKEYWDHKGETYTGTMKIRRHMVNRSENEKFHKFLEEVGEKKKL
ncbi:hypothetical protein [Psychrilyobacter sp.]